MTGTVDEMVRGWDGTAVIHAHDPPTGSRIYVALHDTRLGPAVGGTRMAAYGSPGEALRDAMRLAEGMTYKWAGLGLPFGGGKCVVDVPSVPTGEAREGLFRRYGDLLQALRGSFQTGVDLGTDPEDMDVLAAATSHVMCGSGPDGTVDPGPYTALGVFSGIRAALEHLGGDPDPAGAEVLVQGAGDVGEPLARLLAEAGAELLVADLDAERARRLARATGGAVVDADEVYGTACDVFAPCAVGGVLDPGTIPRLRCRAVVGSANNQLASLADAERLHERGILYAPDFIVNGGGALAFGLLHLGDPGEEELRRRVRGIGETLSELFDEAVGRGESPVHAARRLAEARLEDGPAGG